MQTAVRSQKEEKVILLIEVATPPSGKKTAKKMGIKESIMGVLFVGSKMLELITENNMKMFVL